MGEEFKGNIPNIAISADFNFFMYFCDDTDQLLASPCASRSPLCEECFDCLSFNIRFAKYYYDNQSCSCGRKVDFGYFMLIYLLEKAELLPDNFKMQCCLCKKGM